MTTTKPLTIRGFSYVLNAWRTSSVLCGDLLYYHQAPVAQWIEQETSKLLAVGSIPTRGTKLE